MIFPEPRSLANILVVEDSPTQAAAICDMLERQGYTAHWKATLAEAREMVRAGGADLLLLDRILPDGDGSVLCRELKADPATQETPIILLTVRDRVDDRVEGLVGGANDYIVKPFHPEEFLARVQACLRTLELERELRRRAEELAQKNQELVATQTRLVQSERLAAIGEVGLAIRHEINNPLGTILGHAELLLSHAETLPPDARKRLEAIHRASLRIRDVVRRLEVLREDRTIEYIPGISMTDLGSSKSEESGEARG